MGRLTLGCFTNCRLFASVGVRSALIADLGHSLIGLRRGLPLIFLEGKALVLGTIWLPRVVLGHPRWLHVEGLYKLASGEKPLFLQDVRGQFGCRMQYFF